MPSASNSSTTSTPTTDIDSATMRACSRSGSPMQIEFAGTSVLCRVCGDRASGLHYGIHSCEGCKIFFRRSIQKNLLYRQCTKGHSCSVYLTGRTRCPDCRFRRCVQMGMSRDAVLFDRMPKLEKARIEAERRTAAQIQEAKLSVPVGDANEDEIAKMLSNLSTASDTSGNYSVKITLHRPVELESSEMGFFLHFAGFLCLIFLFLSLN